MAPKTPSVDITIVTKNLRALQGALEHSLTIQRTRLQEIVDDLVSRGSLSRADADGLLNQLLTSSKDYSQALLKVLDVRHRRHPQGHQCRHRAGDGDRRQAGRHRAQGAPACREAARACSEGCGPRPAAAPMHRPSRSPATTR